MKNTAKMPGLMSHAVTLLMPITMAFVIPWLLIAGHQNSPVLWLKIVGTALFLCALILFVSTERLFITVGKGTLAPWDPTKKMVATGPYAYCRNPMISGVLGIILGQALFFNSTTLLVWAAIFFSVNTIYFIAVEEPTLLKKFKGKYATYKQNVPRWIPKIRPYNLS